MNTVGTARAMAQQDFYMFNDVEGFAVLLPRLAKCPICQGWVNRGKVPLAEAQLNPPPYHVRCITPGVEIALSEGHTKPIEEIQVGETIHTRHGDFPVQQVFQRYAEEKSYLISAEDKSIEVTGEHELYSSIGWLPANALGIGDNVIIQSGDGFVFAEIYRIETKDYEGEVFNLQVESEEYIAGGVVVHNCPHYWETFPGKITDCALLWLGG
jgi:hypothetical protein